MDSHVFRILAAELARMLEGARLEKIHGPRPDVLVFTVFAAGRKLRLVFRFGRRAPLLFFSEHVPQNPPAPPASVMRLRKYCAGRRLGRARFDHTSRGIAFPVAGAPGRDSCFLFLDMAQGAFVLRDLPENFGQAPARPGRETIAALCSRAWDKKEKQGPWREFPVLTPLLRETLSFLDPLEGLALTTDLERGEGDLFFYADAEGRPSFYSAWPLPDAQARGRGLFPCAFPTASGENVSLPPAYPALAAVSPLAASLFFAELGDEERRKQEQPTTAARKKAIKLAAKLREEESRLRAMADLGATAESIKAVLWRFPADAAPAQVDVPAGDGSGDTLRITLDPRFRLRENMSRMFRQAARGKRGLETLCRRRSGGAGTESGTGPVSGATAEAAGAGLIAGEPEAGRMSGESEAGRMSEESEAGLIAGEPEAGRISWDSGVNVAAEQVSGGRAGRKDDRVHVRGRPAGTTVARNEDAVSGRAGGPALRNVVRFRSSDGFLMLRGRNAAGNDLLLKSGAAHDYWLHAEGLPGAHVLVRRAHAAEEVPERTLREAAALAAEKSAAQGEATVMVALLRHVRRNAKGAPGAVEIASVLCRIRVDAAEV